MLSQTPLIDVRSPGEFAASHLPNARNIPILNDDQRAQVGTAYKLQGQQAAINLGLSLTAETKSRSVTAWTHFLIQHPQAVLICFRGGLRSGFAQNWLRQSLGLSLGQATPLRWPGGTKSLRQFLLASMQNLERHQFHLVGGLTGSRKTQWLRAQQQNCFIDLEKLAHHRGSIFGGYQSIQPAQATFENGLALELLQNRDHIIFLEDESRMIGHRVIPESVFLKMRDSPVIWLKVATESRVQNILEDYVLKPLAENPENPAQLFDFFKWGVSKISVKLGSQMAMELNKDLDFSFNDFLKNQSTASNTVWIQKLLVHYYDPMYIKNINQRQPKILNQIELSVR